MYVPEHFREDDKAVLQAFIRDHSFGILVTQGEDAPFATHLPFLFDADASPYGTLQAHMARANPQWHSFSNKQEALVIFQGPHAYVSPSWYDVVWSVPTWNYATVHAYGVPRLIEDNAVLYAQLKTLIEIHEAQFEQPWGFQLPEEYIQKMMRSIVGFTLEITRLEGKFKMSQNRTPNEQEKVIAALQDNSADVAQIMTDLKRTKHSK
ncbi:MAG: FMN-binding negative transcriptional regulator [Ktedonobacteraceae bacterium]